MRRVFADTFYYLALLNANDDAHDKAVAFTANFQGSILTTDWVLTELIDGLSVSPSRRRVIEFVDDLRSDRGVRIVPASRRLLQRAWQLYRQRLDKEWSLTDCTSFVVMRDARIVDALTGDQHFEQAGFKRLLR